MDAAPVRRAAQASLEFGRGEIQRHERVTRRRLSAYDRATGHAGQLYAGPKIRKSRIVLLAYLYVDPGDFPVKLRDFRQLRLGVRPQPVAHLGMPALDDDVHTGSFRRFSGTCVER